MYSIDYKDKQFLSLTSFTTQSKFKHYLNILKENDVWLVSEAWAPGLSDPWKSMIKLCNENWLLYSILPWANALVPAIVGSWFDTSEFIFLWFLPQKKGRQTKLRRIMDSSLRSEWHIPVFFYESVHRIEKLLCELKGLNFGWQISIAREISKMFEQYFTGSIQETIDLVKEKKLPLKWEFVIWLKN